jgi:ABC-type transport system involved in multi-copper enzyme maturation permease subunit
VILLILVAVGVVLLVQRHRDRRPLGDSTQAQEVHEASDAVLGDGGAASPANPAASSANRVVPSVTTVGGTTIAMAKELPPGRYGISGLLRSEWTKLRSVRSTLWTLGLTVLLGVVIGVIATWATRANWSTTSAANQASFDPIGRSLIGVYFGQFTIGILGVLVVTAEYATGTIRATFSAAPRRISVLAAKTLVFGIVALITSEIVAFASFFLGQAFLTPPAIHATIGSPDALRAVAGSGLYLGVMGLFALGLGTIIRHTAGAISAFVGLLLVLPLIVAALPSSLNDDVSRFMPLRIGAAMVSGRPLSHTFSPWTGLAVLCAYSIVFLVAGLVLLVKRDA